MQVGIAQLCEVLNSCALQTLVLSTNSLGDEGAELLAQKLSANRNLQVSSGAAAVPRHETSPANRWRACILSAASWRLAATSYSLLPPSPPTPPCSHSSFAPCVTHPPVP